LLQVASKTCTDINDLLQHGLEYSDGLLFSLFCGNQSSFNGIFNTFKSLDDGFHGGCIEFGGKRDHQSDGVVIAQLGLECAYHLIAVELSE
jgi:hypothetical protein